jgi:hypothetical protein
MKFLNHRKVNSMEQLKHCTIFKHSIKIESNNNVSSMLIFLVRILIHGLYNHTAEYSKSCTIKNRELVKPLRSNNVQEIREIFPLKQRSCLGLKIMKYY